MNQETIRERAGNLTKKPPRSPRALLAGYVIAARTLDKCRAVLNGTNGDYKFDCPLDNLFFSFAEIKAEDFKQCVATGASDAEVEAWIEKNAKERPRIEVIKWNNRMRSLRVCDLPDHQQEFMEDYMLRFVPSGRVVYNWFDVYDLEEGRL